MDAFLFRKSADAIHKLRDVLGNLAFAQRHLRPGRDMHHAVAIPQVVQHMRHVVILRACEHIHMHAHFAELAREFADVDVHTAGIFATQRRQWTSVIRKHCNSHHCIHHDNMKVPKLARNIVILYNPRRYRQATVAQMAVQPIRNRQVMGSNPIGGSLYSTFRV